jgi:hypothetical protein
MSRNSRHNVLFYEPNGPDMVDDHTVITFPSLEQLKNIFFKEGIDGLKGYNVLVPVYITDDGDLFGTPDIGPDGKVNHTHKIIVVQRFSIYEVVKNTFNSQLFIKAKLQEHVGQHINDSKNFYTLAFVAMILLDIIIILVFFVYSTAPNNKSQ